MKKFACLILAAVLCMALCAPVFAASPAAEDSHGAAAEAPHGEASPTANPEFAVGKLVSTTHRIQVVGECPFYEYIIGINDGSRPEYVIAIYYYEPTLDKIVLTKTYTVQESAITVMGGFVPDVVREQMAQDIADCIPAGLTRFG